MNHAYMEMQEKIKKTTQKGIEFLEARQQKSGGFLSFTTKNAKNFNNAQRHNSTFPACLILSCLNSVEVIHELPLQKKLQRTKQKITHFLLSQKSEYWTFNYWVRDSREAKNEPYPDDLDVMCCALAALFQYDEKLVDGEALSRAVMVLTSLEQQEGGPYRTWLVPPDADKAWKDIDLAVNANIGHFLLLQEVELDKLNELTETAIKKKKYHSPYYSTQYSVIYFISRFYQGAQKKKIVEFLLNKQNKNHHWGNPLDTAFACSALLNFGYPARKLEKPIEYLLLAAKRDCSWEAHPFVVERIIKKKKHHSGCAELTTAFCLEALQKYAGALKATKIPVKKQQKDKAAEKIYGEVLRLFKKRMILAGKGLKGQAENTLTGLFKQDNLQKIILLPYIFKKALGKNGKKVSQKVLVQLGLANLLGWLAYTIYDDFIDEEGDPKNLPLANLCLRELTMVFSGVLSKKEGKEFNLFFRQVMDQLEQAHHWEVTRCRIQVEKMKFAIPQKLPNDQKHSKLADRSRGHALGPLAILFSLGHSQNSFDVKNAMAFFHHYLIARQLSDDMHDWEEDLKRGQLNSSVVALLKKWRSKKKKKNIDLNIDLEKLQELFWYEVVTEMCEDLLAHVEKAKQALKKLRIVEHSELLETMLTSVEQATQKTLKEQAEAVKFLKAYEKG